jgi:hypothetical protein
MKPRIIFSVGAMIFISAISTAAQTNLLVNPNADAGNSGWRVVGNAKVEDFNGNNVFVIRSEDNGQIYGLHQIVDLKRSDVGRYVLFIGQGTSERINPDGAITGLPSLYGYMLKSYWSKGAQIVDYSQGQGMLGRSSRPLEWVTMWGIFRVPKETVAIQFMLNQASQRGVPHSGSAARFRRLGLYLFDSEPDARRFINEYEQHLRTVQ